MIDHLLGRPSTGLKRVQVLLVIAFWSWVLKKGGSRGPAKRIPALAWLDKHARRFSPWQLIVFTMTSIYAVRHVDALFGFGAPEPLARMYSRSFYRVTWIVTALDAGFATAMTIRPVWLRDIASLAFSLYYLVYANEADEKLRKFRAFCTIEMMRVTWHKTTNPYIRAVTSFHRPSLGIARPLLLPRPTLGAHGKRPTRAWLFYVGTEKLLREEEELLLDLPGGGFVCMDPRHHEERLRQLAKEMQRPVLSVDYCKAPEYPYPYALEECYDLYRTLYETGGRVIGMSGSSRFRTILTGDSAGGNLATGVLIKVIEYPQPHIRSAYAQHAAGGPGSKPPVLPKPLAMVFAYPSLNFGFTSWMKPDHVRVLRQQSEVSLQSVSSGESGRKGSPLNPARSRSRSRRSSVSQPAIIRSSVSSSTSEAARQAVATSSSAAIKDKTKGGVSARRSYSSLASQAELHLAERARFAEAEPASDEGGASPHESSTDMAGEWDKAIWMAPAPQDTLDPEAAAALEAEEQQRALQRATQLADMEHGDRQRTAPVNTRLTMTSMAGYFQDRILTQSMMRAMAILYVGPRRQPDFDHDYFLSPIVAPARLLAEFPPSLFICGEKDPICDDTVVMAGRIREAKLAKQNDLRRRRAGASARFGEQLRMSMERGHGLQHESIEDETVEDWVQMRIIEGYSHGFLQMSSLLPEAKQIISFLGSWMTETFDDFNDELDEQRTLDSMDKLAVITREHSSPVKASSLPTAGLVAKGKVASSPLVSPVRNTPEAQDEADAEDDDDQPLSFTPKSFRSPSTHTAELHDVSPALEVNGFFKLLPSAAEPVTTNPRSRPSSFSASTSDAHARPKQIVNLAAQSEEDAGPLLRRRSFDGNPANGSAVASVRRAAREAPRRGSKEGGATALDEKYQAMLVKESSLLQRRRDDALASMGNSSSAVHSDEEDEEDDTRGRRA